MRLLSLLPSGDFTLTSFDDEHPPDYAILSHTWGDEEVTYEKLLGSMGKEKIGKGYAKLNFCAAQATADGIPYFWVDTCCINKSMAVELQSAINSMFKWYRSAVKCYVYLPDVSVPKDVKDAETSRTTWIEAFRRSRWFTRGWTLQELLAPDSVEFFSKECRRLGDRLSLLDEIHGITELPVEVLRGQNITERSVDERLRWADKRTTTVKEDKIYCLLGIFGVFLPLNYGEGAKYAKERLREEIDKRQRGRGIEYLHDLPVSPPLPFPRNEVFVGRDNELKLLKQTLLSKGNIKIHRRTTVYGLGGSGKSAIALELAYLALVMDARYKVFWVPAISHKSFELAYREIGVRLRIPGIDDGNANVKELVKDRLSSPSLGDWLMIVDNADDYEVLFGADSEQDSSCLFDWLPRSNVGSILFTTRNGKMAQRMTPDSENIDLGKMEAALAGQILRRRIAKKDLLNDNLAVDEFLTILDNLPLAIVQATAFINNNNITVAHYVSLFQDISTNTVELFSEHFEDQSRYQEMDNTIAKTWHISFEQIRRQDPIAAEYLSFMACIDRINIPQSILPPEHSSFQRLKALGTLIGYSFITEQQQAQGVSTDRLFDMHRLVHMASALWLDGHNERVEWANKAVDRVLELVPIDHPKGREVWTMYLPHAIHVAGLSRIVKETTSAVILDLVGKCQASLGQYQAAETTHRQALSLRAHELGDDDELTLRSLNEVALAVSNQGRYTEAESLFRHVLVAREKLLNINPLWILASMSNLANALTYQGKYEQAESLYRNVVAQQHEELGPDSNLLLQSMGNLALVLNYRDKNEEAESLNRAALEGKTKLLGRGHPNTCTTMNNLAAVLKSLGNKSEALALTKEALHHTTEALGPDHPHTMVSLNNLIQMLDPSLESEAMIQDLLERRQKVLGPEHPDTMATMQNLAMCMDSQDSQYKPEAEVVARKSLALHEKVLGPNHLDTILSVWGLAIILGHDLCFEESRALYERAYAGLCAARGQDHPSTRQCRFDWDEMLAVQEASRSTPEKLISWATKSRLGQWRPFGK